jgi:hypothetical protein
MLNTAHPSPLALATTTVVAAAIGLGLHLPTSLAETDPQELPAAEAAAEEAPTAEEAPATEEQDAPADENADQAATEEEPPAETSYVDGLPVVDGGTVGPDMSGAQEAGLPVAGGVSCNPLDVLLLAVEQNQAVGLDVYVTSADSESGSVAYNE